MATRSIARAEKCLGEDSGWLHGRVSLKWTTGLSIPLPPHVSLDEGQNFLKHRLRGSGVIKKFSFTVGKKGRFYFRSRQHGIDYAAGASGQRGASSG